MILDAVTFHSIEMEIAHGIAHGGATMGETMHTMTAAIMRMPVVKKIIECKSTLCHKCSLSAIHTVRQATRMECANVVTTPCW